MSPVSQNGFLGSSYFLCDFFMLKENRRITISKITKIKVFFCYTRFKYDTSKHA